ncbi:hypothetical protein SAMN04515695_1709 [Pseudovibrio sp. Tun.PSC04-5.I4]|nr:hypothetical protein SAMN04515695_1709 [Pseudovibrio sp. Tun.PSC04-5.I4]
MFTSAFQFCLCEITHGIARKKDVAHFPQCAHLEQPALLLNRFLAGVRLAILTKDRVDIGCAQQFPLAFFYAV